MVFEDTVLTKLKAIDVNVETTFARIGKAYDRTRISATKHMEKATLLGKVYDKLDDKQKKLTGGLFKFQNTMMAGGAEAERLRSRLMKLNETVDKQKGFFQRANAQIFRYRMAYISLAIGVMIVKRTLEATWEGLRTGAMINEQRSALDRLAAGYGTTADIIIGDLRRISKETISNAAIAQSAGRAMVMGIAPDTLKSLMAVATAGARVMGETTEKMFADITLGTARMSKKILDNIGIIVDWRAAYAKQAVVIGTTVDALNAEEKMVARTNAIKEAGGRIVDILNTKYKTQREKLDELTASWDNHVAKIQSGFADIVAAPEGMDAVIRQFEFLNENLALAQSEIGERHLKEQTKLSEILIKSYRKQLKSQKDIRTVMSGVQKELTISQDLLAKVTDATKIEKLTKAYDRNNNSLEISKQKVEEWSDALFAAEAEIYSLDDQMGSANKSQIKGLDALKDKQFEIIETYRIQKDEAVKAFKTIEENSRLIATAITALNEQEREKRLSGIVKLQEKYIKETKKAEDSITNTHQNELQKRFLALTRYYEQQTAKIAEVEVKALEKIKEGSKAALEVHKAADKARSDLDITRLAKLEQLEVESAKKVEAVWKKSLETLGLDHSNFIEKQMSEALKAFGAIGDMGDLGTGDKIKALEGLRLKVNDIVEAIEPEKTLGIDTDTATQNLASFNVDLNQLFSDLERTATKTTKEIETTGDTLSIKLKSVAVDTNTFIANATASVTNLLKTNFTQLRNETITEGDLRKAVVTSNLEAMEQSVAKYASDFKQHEVDITTVIEQQFQKRMIALDKYIAGISSAQTNLLQLNPPPSLPGEFTGYTGSFASGLDLVPRDMTARIHKGERIQRADENPFNPAATNQDQRQDNRTVSFNIYQQPGESPGDLVDQLDAAMRLPGDFI